MAGPFQTREIEIVRAIADTIFSRTSLLQTTTVQTASAVGDQLLNLASSSGFVEDGYLHFFDNTGEPMVGITSVTGNQLALRYGGYASKGLPVGLQYVHLSGAKVATNLMMHRPLGIAPMLKNGQPVLAIWPGTKRVVEHTMGSTNSPLVIHLQVHIALQQYDADPIDPEVYNQFQQEACWNYLQTVENALNQNRHLTSNYNNPGPHADGLGDGKSTEIIRTSWDVFTESQVVDIPQAIGAMQVIVRPRRYVRLEPGT